MLNINAFIIQDETMIYCGWDNNFYVNHADSGNGYVLEVFSNDIDAPDDGPWHRANFKTLAGVMNEIELIELEQV